ncbi:MAG: alpha/beta hydrolase [Clostridia bacterium]|nr:alpha/beta hydrolase [Clostridia bacterium]
MLFLHGYLSSKEAFNAQIAYFSQFYRVTAIDFLGFGKSGPLKSAFSVADYAAWTKEVIELLGVKNPHIVAHSFGCRVAVKMASTHKTAFDKLVLTGPAGVILKRGLSYRFKVGLYRFVKRFAPRFAERRFGSAEYRSLPPLMKESYKKIVNEDLRECAKGVLREVLLVEGKADKTTPLAEAEAYLRAFPYAKLVQTEGGHFAFAENPVAFNLIVEEFLYG